jgi:TP901 family phage tail tape measure protein
MDLARLGIALQDRGIGTVDAALTRVDSRFAKITGSVVALNQGIALLGRGARMLQPLIGIGATFEESMVKSTAIMGDLSEAMQNRMTAAARAVARESDFAAREAADAFFFLASAGLDAEQSIGALPLVTQFATAGAFNLALATDLLTDAQSALGLTIRDDVTANMQNMARMSDVLVKANTLANATVQQFSEALTNKAGAALRTVNKDVEEGVAVLAAFADQGVKGAYAGTQLSIVLRDLQSKALANKEEFKRFGVTVFDDTGKLANLGDVIEDLEYALGGLSDEEARARIQMMGFADRSVQALLTLLGTSENIKAFETNLRNATGTTMEVAKKQLSAITKQFGMLGSDIRDLSIGLFQDLGPGLHDVVGEMRDWVRMNEDWIQQDLIGFFRTTGTEARKVAEAIGTVGAPLWNVIELVGQIPEGIWDVGLIAALMWGVSKHPVGAAFIGGPMIGQWLAERKQLSDIYHDLAREAEAEEGVFGRTVPGSTLSQEHRNRLLDEARDIVDRLKQERETAKDLSDPMNVPLPRIQETIAQRLEETGGKIDDYIETLVAASGQVALFVTEGGTVVNMMSAERDAFDDVAGAGRNLIMVVDEFGNVIGRRRIPKFTGEIVELSDALQKLARKLTAEYRTPLEQYGETVDTLGVLYKAFRDSAGEMGISLETYKRALAAVTIETLGAEDAAKEYQATVDAQKQAVDALIGSVRQEGAAMEDAAHQLRLSVRPAEALAERLQKLEDMRLFHPKEIDDDVFRDLVSNAARDFDKLEQSGRGAMQGIEDAVEGVGKHFKDVWVDMLVEGEADADRFIEAIKRDFAELATQEFLIDPIFGGFKRSLQEFKAGRRAEGLIRRAGGAGGGTDAEAGGVPPAVRAQVMETLGLVSDTGQQFNDTINEFDHGFLSLLDDLSAGVGWFLTSLLGGGGGFSFSGLFGSIGIGALTGLFGGMGKTWGNWTAPPEAPLGPGLGHEEVFTGRGLSRAQAPAAQRATGPVMQITNTFVFPSPDPKMAADIVMAQMPKIEARLSESFRRGRTALSRSVGKR